MKNIVPFLPMKLLKSVYKVSRKHGIRFNMVNYLFIKTRLSENCAIFLNEIIKEYLRHKL